MAEYLPNPNLGGITLKALLENPNLLLPPPPTNTIRANGEKDGKDDYFYDSEVVDMAAAFLGPTLWDKTLPTDSDFKLEYMDIDEFLAENGLGNSAADGITKGNDAEAVPDALNSAAAPPAHLPADSPLDCSAYPLTISSPVAGEGSPHPGSDIRTYGEASMCSQLSPPSKCSRPNSPSECSRPNSPSECSRPNSPTDLSLGVDPESPLTPAPGSPSDDEVPIAVSSTDVALATAPGQEEFDPREKTFTAEELKPQPMMKKSKKQYVPSELKDDKYWERRRKNNIAAKRSRDARRIKENQIVCRTSFLEQQNSALKEQVSELKSENSSYKDLLESYKKKLEALSAL